MTAYENRRDRMYDWMAQEGISMVMLEDAEGKRDPAVRWLTGQPGDALLFLSVDRRCVLVPWDANMAKIYADADAIVPYGEFERQAIKAARAAAESLKLPASSRVEIPSVTPYPAFLKFVEGLGDYDVLCRDGGAAEEIEAMRAVKDEEEIRLYREISRITNEVIDLLETELTNGRMRTETEVALFIEEAARVRGCEGTGFETIAAGPSRSFGIHAVPAYTADAFGGPGLSILDFGLKFHGYTSDVTLTLAHGPLNRTQERMLSLTQKAYDLALGMCAADVPTREIALAVDALFAKGKKVMPHSLGHGIGLEAHEAPWIRSRADNEWRLAPGMIFTLEPGLYDPVNGGCRLENDVILTEKGAEAMTRSRIIRI
jgi:Xaa-Pro dipeptidase